MKKILFLLIFMPLVLYSQEVFSSAYNQGLGTYSTRGPGAQFIKSNNARLRNETCDYNQALSSQFEKLRRTPPYEKNIMTNPVPWGVQENTKQPVQQNRQVLPADNSLQIERKNPKWWRQEGSFQGWGFD